MPRVRFSFPAMAAVLGVLLLAFVSTGGAQAGAVATSEPNLVRPDLPHSITPALHPGSKENTNVVVQNVGTGPATMVMDFYTPGGVLIPAASEVFTGVPVDATRTFTQAVNSGLVQGFRGVGRISADQEVNAILARDMRTPTGGRSYSIHNAFAEGATEVAVPLLLNKNGGLERSTRMAIANTGTSTSCVTIEYSFPPPSTKPAFIDSGPGGLGCASGHPIPAGGQITFAPGGVDGAMDFPATTVGQVFAANVSATGSPVVVAVDTYRKLSAGRNLASYDGFPATDLSTSMLMPVSIKSPDGFFSQDFFLNPNNAVANVTSTYNGTVSGAPFTAVVNTPVPANGTAQDSVYDTGSPIPVGFIGSVAIISDQPIAAVGFRQKMTTANSFVYQDLYTAINAIPVDQAATEWKVPLTFRRAYDPSDSRFGFNTWIAVQVADGSTANVTLETVNDTTNAAPNCQQTATYTSTTAVNGIMFFYQNSDNTTENGLGANPTCVWGGTTVTSDKPVVVVANATNDLSKGDNDGSFNGFSE